MNRPALYLTDADVVNITPIEPVAPEVVYHSSSFYESEVLSLDIPCVCLWSFAINSYLKLLVMDADDAQTTIIPAPFDEAFESVRIIETEVQVKDLQLKFCQILDSRQGYDILLVSQLSVYSNSKDDQSTMVMCHKWILSIHSDYFRNYTASHLFNAFTTNAKETVILMNLSPNSNIIPLEHEYPIINGFVMYCYGGYDRYKNYAASLPTFHSKELELEYLVNSLQYANYIIANGFYMELLNDIENHYICCESVCSLLQFAVDTHISSLREKTMSFIARNMYVVDNSSSEKEEIHELHITNFHTLAHDIQISLLLLQRSYKRYHAYNQSHNLITDYVTVKEIISMIAECLEEEIDRYVTAKERLIDEIKAYNEMIILKELSLVSDLKLPTLRIMSESEGSLFDDTATTTIPCNTNTISSNSTFGQMFQGLFHTYYNSNKQINDMLGWKYRILKVDECLYKQNIHIRIQKQFYNEQRNALQDTT